MTYAAIATSVRRNSAWLTQSQREQFKPCASEIASLARHAAAVRAGVRMPGERK